MRGFVDTHCHFLPAIDDGVRSAEEGLALLRALHQAGFDHVVATPHIRTAMFENRAPGLRAVFETMQTLLAQEGASATSEASGTTDGLVTAPMTCPAISLAAEHYFDEVAYQLLMTGQGLPYGVGKAALIEFSPERPPLGVEARFFELRLKRVRPIVAHPERYEVFWQDPLGAATNLRRAGGVLLLDSAALVGKYGTRAQRAAEKMLVGRAYYAACSDAHRPSDVDDVREAMEVIRTRQGEAELRRLFVTGPRSILEGKILDALD